MSKNFIKLQSKEHLFRKKSAGAFTFVEVIIALAIISISLLSLIRLHMINLKMNDSAEITSQAAFLAQEKLAEISASPLPAQGSDRGTVERYALTFDWHTEVENLNSPQLDKEQVSGLKKISIDITWQLGAGKKHLRMSTLIADRNIL
jgi:type II secretion system protein I